MSSHIVTVATPDRATIVDQIVSQLREHLTNATQFEYRMSRPPYQDWGGFPGENRHPQWREGWVTTATLVIHHPPGGTP